MPSIHVKVRTTPPLITGNSELLYTPEVMPPLPKMRSVYMLVTPEWAADVLTKNKGNRPTRLDDIRKLASEMTEGRWLLTHQGLAIAVDGTLLDGQHRLEAVVRSGCSVMMTVFFDCDPAIFAVTDNGRVRPVQYRLKSNSWTVAIANMTLDILTGVNYYRSQHLLAEVIPWVTPWVDTLMAYTPTAAKNRSAAPVRMAVITRMMLGEQDYVLPLYRDFVLLEFAALPPIALSLLKQIDRHMTGPRDRWDYVARCWVAFDPDKAKVDRLSIHGPTTSLEEMRKVLKRSRDRNTKPGDH